MRFKKIEEKNQHFPIGTALILRIDGSLAGGVRCREGKRPEYDGDGVLVVICRSVAVMDR